ncbi:uncharacterized protein DS421_3g64130 [Arachis hypogaea]|nr:uncharacterized protein DS421_3g64130 [Arachis hypogaea]
MCNRRYACIGDIVYIYNHYLRKLYFPGTIREMFESWHGLHNRQQGQQMWMTVFFAVIWNIWLERNARIFKNTRASLEVIHTKTVMSYTEWRGGDSGGGC